MREIWQSLLFLFLFLYLGFESVYGFQDKIVLKDRGTVLCDIQSENTTDLNVKVGTATIVLSRNVVDRIEYDPSYPSNKDYRAMFRLLSRKFNKDFLEYMLKVDHKSLRGKDLEQFTDLESEFVRERFREVGNIRPFFVVGKCLDTNPQLLPAMIPILESLYAEGKETETILFIANRIDKDEGVTKNGLKQALQNLCLKGTGGRTPGLRDEKHPNFRSIDLLRLAAILKASEPENEWAPSWPSNWIVPFRNLVKILDSEYPTPTKAGMSVDGLVLWLLQNQALGQQAPTWADEILKGGLRESYELLKSNQDAQFQYACHYVAVKCLRGLRLAKEKEQFPEALYAVQILRTICVIPKIRELASGDWPPPERIYVSSPEALKDSLAKSPGENLNSVVEFVDAQTDTSPFSNYLMDRAIRNDPACAYSTVLNARAEDLISSWTRQLQNGYSPDRLSEDVSKTESLLPNTFQMHNVSDRVKALKAMIERQRKGINAKKAMEAELSPYDGPYVATQDTTETLVSAIQMVDKTMLKIVQSEQQYTSTTIHGDLATLKRKAELLRSDMIQKCEKIEGGKRTRERKEQERLAEIARRAEADKAAAAKANEMAKMRLAQEPIRAVVEGFLAGQPEYEKIVTYWDPKSESGPTKIAKLLEKDILSININGDYADVNAKLRFQNANGAEFDGVFKVRLVMRSGKWYIMKLDK